MASNHAPLCFLFVTLLSGFAPKIGVAHPYRDLQWGLKNRGIPQSLTIDHYTSAKIDGVPGEDIRLPDVLPEAKQRALIAVLDTGIDLEHPLLKDRISPLGFNFVNQSQDVQDQHGHGTHVSGIIVEVSKNVDILPIKVVQTGPNAPIRPQTIGGGAGTALTENVAAGVRYAVDHGAHVINLSLAWPRAIHSRKMDEAVAYAKQNQVVIVSSAGNDSTLANVFPCIYDEVICVGSHGPDGAPSHFTNFGPMVDILAPGTSILSSWPLTKTPSVFTGQKGYEFRNGTSMAAPFVAGAIGELIAQGFSSNVARSKLLSTTRTPSKVSLFRDPNPIPGTLPEPTTDKYFGGGMLDLEAAIQHTSSVRLSVNTKKPFEVSWSGQESKQTIDLQIVNQGAETGPLKLIINNSAPFTHPGLGENETWKVPFHLLLKPDHESRIELPYSLYLDGSNVPLKSSMILVSIKRIISESDYPLNTEVNEFQNLNVTEFNKVRSIINQDSKPRLDLGFFAANETSLKLVIARDHIGTASLQLPNVNPDQVLNLYRVSDSEYYLVSTFTTPRQMLPNYQIYGIRFHEDTNKLTLIEQYKIGTDITVLNESFRWTKIKGKWVPIWVSIGFTPKEDLPPYDPWNPDFKDVKRPRVFYVSDGKIRTIKLKPSETPIQLLDPSTLLVSDGNNYFQKLILYQLQDGEVYQPKEVYSETFRMLIGANYSKTMTPKSENSFFSGPGGPGEFWVKVFSENSVFDYYLNRSSSLEAIAAMVGTYSENQTLFSVAQSHYDLKFYRSDLKRTLRTSLNRYSYIPSLIFNRNFYLTRLASDNEAQGVPAVYISASLGNEDTSEFIFPNDDFTSLKRPARLRFTTSPECLGLGNLYLSATRVHQVFICGNKRLIVPITTSPLTTQSKTNE